MTVVPVPVEQLESLLSLTEPIVPLSMDGVDPVSFSLPAGWNVVLKETPGDQITDAQILVSGQHYSLTKDAVLLATSGIGLTRDYVCKTPGHLIEAELNYWYSQVPSSDLTLTKFGTVLALTDAHAVPVSNVGLLEVLCSGIEGQFGPTFSHPVFNHDLRLTQFRIYAEVPLHTVVTSRQGVEVTDTWSIGVDVQNSLTCNGPLQIRGFLVGDSDLTGVTRRTVARFSRKGSPTPESALAWAEKAVQDALADTEIELTSLDALVKTSIEGSLNDTTQDVFERYRVPVAARKLVMEKLVDDEDLTMYGMLRALSSVANSPDIGPLVVRKLMEVGGELIVCASGRCESCFRLPLV